MSNQIWVMASALVCGLLIALFYDIYWLFIAYRKRPLWLAALQDMLFWLAAFCLVAALWLYCTGGVMRLYVYIWLGLGIFLFRRLLSRRLRRLRPRPKLPPAVYRQAQEKAADLPQRQLPPRLKRLGALPAGFMLQAGRGWWLGLAWSARHGRRGLAWSVQHGRRGAAWLKLHLPHKKDAPPPEEED